MASQKLNLTSHIAHPTFVAQDLFSARPDEFRYAHPPKARFNRASASDFVFVHSHGEFYVPLAEEIVEMDYSQQLTFWAHHR